MAFALVTGANGFIGSHLVERLLAEGHRVRCLVRAASDRRWIQDLPVEFVVGDVTDPVTLPPAVAGADWIFHLGGAVKALDEAAFVKINAEGTRHLAEAAVHQGTRRIVLISSLAAAGPSPDGHPLGEDDPPRPVSAYGRSKLAAEEAVFRSGAPAVVLRPPAVYGPRDRDVLVFFRMAARGLALIIGDAKRPLSLVHVSDLVSSALCAATETDIEGRTYFVSDGRIHDWIGVVEALGRALGRRPRRLKVPSPVLGLAAWIEERRAARTGGRPLLTRERLREFRSGAWVCDGSRASRELKLKPPVALEQGLASTAAWYRENGWL
jgi:nucleoside-diphosphate-sugar epimerase